MSVYILFCKVLCTVMVIANLVQVPLTIALKTRCSIVIVVKFGGGGGGGGGGRVSPVPPLAYRMFLVSVF